MITRYPLKLEEYDVVAFASSNDTITIELRATDWETSDIDHIEVKFHAVRNLHISSDTKSEIGLLHQDGNLIHFEINEQKATLIIEWLDYEPRSSKMTSVYNFDFGSVEISQPN